MRALLTRLVLAVVLTVSGFAGTGAPFAAQTFQGISDPRSYTGLQAWYDISDVSSLRNNAGAVPSTGEGIKLVADKSGNSGVNVLCLNGVAGNYASAPDSVALDITGSITLMVEISPTDVPPSVNSAPLSKYGGSGTNSAYRLITDSAGKVVFQYSNDGTVSRQATSSATIASAGYSAFSKFGIRADYNSGTGAVDFYTSPDFVNWSALGTQQTITAGSIFISTAALAIGAQSDAGTGVFKGNIYRARVYDGIFGSGGTLTFDANFSLPAKLATSFTESSSNAATVTINTSGATGARISGARDLVQMTAANQPILTIAAGGNYLTFDGSNDYLKAAAFSLSQPETVYFVGSQVTWVLNDYIYDGNATASGSMVQSALTPEFINNSGGALGVNAGWALNVRAVITTVFNAAASLNRVNRAAANTGTMGSTSMKGFTLGDRGAGGVTPTNITASEVLIYSNAANTAQQDATIGYLARKWGISGGFAHMPPPNVIPFEPNIAPWKREDELMAA